MMVSLKRLMGTGLAQMSDQWNGWSGLKANTYVKWSGSSSKHLQDLFSEGEKWYGGGEGGDGMSDGLPTMLAAAIMRL